MCCTLCIASWSTRSPMSRLSPLASILLASWSKMSTSGMWCVGLTNKATRFNSLVTAKTSTKSNRPTTSSTPSSNSPSPSLSFSTSLQSSTSRRRWPPLLFYCLWRQWWLSAWTMSCCTCRIGRLRIWLRRSMQLLWSGMVNRRLSRILILCPVMLSFFKPNRKSLATAFYLQVRRMSTKQVSLEKAYPSASFHASTSTRQKTRTAGCTKDQ